MIIFNSFYTLLQYAVFVLPRGHSRYPLERFSVMRKRIEAQRRRNFGKTLIFAYKFFALFDFEFEIITYYRLTRAFFEGLANRRFAVMERVGNGVERYVAVNVVL